MTNRLWQTAIDRVGVLAAPLALDAQSDADLLQRFTVDRDEQSYSALIRRHGPLVWSVCRSLLASEADAEDAFQATFLVLVRSASRVKKPNALGAWLHTVAGRVCRNSLRSLARRRKHERKAAVKDGEQPVESAAWERWQAIAHEEISRLPETLRVPFVLCVLQGVRQPEAAERLGWKIGTVSGRVCKAKQALTEALSRRGIAAGILATLGAATMPIEASLGQKAAHMIRVGAGPHGDCSTTIHELARGAMGGFMTKTKLLATALVVGVLGIGIGTKVLSQADAQGPPPGGGGPPGVGAPPAPPAPPPLPGGVGAANPFGGGGSSGTSGFGMLPHPKVEYTFLPKSGSSDEFKKTLSKRGEDGWEFAGLIPGTDEIILKRMARTSTMGSGMGGMGGMGMGPGAMGGGMLPGMGGTGSGRIAPGAGAPPVGIGGGVGSGSSGAPGAPSAGGPGGGGPIGPGGSGGVAAPVGGGGFSGSGGSSMKPADSFDLRIGETIRHRVSARQSIDRIFGTSVQVVDVNPDPTDSTKVLIKGLSAGTAKVELTDATGTKITLTIRVVK